MGRRGWAFGVAALVWTAAGPMSAQEKVGREPDGVARLGRELLVPDAPTGLCGGEPCDAVARGLLHFFDRSPDGMAGNGRSCNDCHMVTDRFQLSPASAEGRFRFLQWLKLFDPNADDPLFRPIDADDFRVNGDDASDFGNLRQNGLIRVSFDLPGNVKLVDPATNAPSAETFVDVWRSVPTVNDVKLTGPDGLNPWPRDPNRTDDWNKLDTPALRGIGKTAPYFHNNSEATLAGVVNHYVQLFKRIEALALPGAPPPPVASTDGVHFDRIPLPAEIPALLAYLRKL